MPPMMAMLFPILLAGTVEKPITIYGDETQSRSFCYVEDLIETFVPLMDTRQFYWSGQYRQSR